MHAEPGLTSERRSGIRAATTFRKLPNARPGRNAMAATATPISEGLAVAEDDVVEQHEALARAPQCHVDRERHRQRRAWRAPARRDGNRHAFGVLSRLAAAATGEARRGGARAG